MPIEGSLRELNVEDVLQLLSLARKTGALSVRSDRLNDDAIVHFSHGDIVFAVRRRSARHIGRLLVRTGKLTQRALDAALAIQHTDRARRFAEILIDIGAVTRDEVDRQLLFQMEETMHELLAWNDGSFRFEERKGIAGQRRAATVRVDALLMEGARRHDEWARFETVVRGPASVPVLAGADVAEPPPLELDVNAWELLAEIDGERDIGRLAADTGRSVFDVAMTVRRLVDAGVAEVRDQRGGFDEPRAASAAGLDPPSPDAHYELGITALRTGDFERAARAWDTYVRLSANGERREEVMTMLSAVRTITQFLNGATNLER